MAKKSAVAAEAKPAEELKPAAKKVAETKAPVKKAAAPKPAPAPEPEPEEVTEETVEQDEPEAEEAETEESDETEATEEAGAEMSDFDAMLDCIAAEDPLWNKNTSRRDTQAFLRMLIKKLNVCDDHFKDLPDTAKDWFDEAADIMTGKKSGVQDIPLPNGFTPAEAKPAKAKDAKAPAADKEAIKQQRLDNLKKARETRAAKIASGEKTTTKKEPKPGRPTRESFGPTTGQRVRNIIVRNPTIKPEDLIKHPDLAGIKESTIRTFHTDALGVIKAAQAAGVWSGK